MAGKNPAAAAGARGEAARAMSVDRAAGGGTGRAGAGGGGWRRKKLECRGAFFDVGLRRKLRMRKNGNAIHHRSSFRAARVRALSKNARWACSTPLTLSAPPHGRDAN